MTDRRDLEQLLRELHASRLEANLERLCGLFAADARLRITGTGDGKPIVVTAEGIEQIRTWLAMLLKTFRLTDYRLLSTLIDGHRAAAHWRVHIRSRITGRIVDTELIDLVEARGAQITAYTEFFLPC